MFFNPDSSKLAQEMLFSKKKKKRIQVHPIISLSNVHVERVPDQKHLQSSEKCLEQN